MIRVCMFNIFTIIKSITYLYARKAQKVACEVSSDVDLNVSKPTTFTLPPKTVNFTLSARQIL